MDFQKTKKHLMEASFDKKQWRELSAICEIRQGVYSTKSKVLREESVDVGEEHVRLFYERLKEYLLSHNKCGVAPLRVLEKARPTEFKNVKSVAGRLYELAGEWNTVGKRHRNFSIGVYHLYMQLVVDYLESCRVPVSAKAVLQHVDKFEGLVDRAYPGYIEAGLLPLIVSGDIPNHVAV